MNSESEFLKAIQNLPQPKPLEIEYRFHYDDHGNIYSFSMIEPHPENTQYLVVDKDTYEHFYRYKVVNHQLKLIDKNPGYHVQLHKSTQGYRVVRDHAGIILGADEAYPNVEYYAAN